MSRFLNSARSVFPSSSSSNSSSPSSTNQTPLRTPPSRTTRLKEEEDSPTSHLLAQLGGLSLRDSRGQGDSPIGRETRVKGREEGERNGDFGGSINFSTKGKLEDEGAGGSLGLVGIQENEIRVHENDKGTENGRQRTSSRDELALLVVSSSITELSMTIQELSTLIFEIQELRHTSSTRPSTSKPAKDGDGFSNNAVSEMDKALMKLNERLDEVRKEFNDIESQVKPMLEASSTSTNESSEVYFLREKWKSTLEEWDGIQKDADMLGEEMKEDKWLVVFNSVIKQAEDMMVSLEKILNQSHQFVWDVNRRKGRSSSSTTSDSSRLPASTSVSSLSSFSTSSHQLPHADIQPLLSSFVALHRSLHAKVKYYSPACDRVLKILGKGISDRSTKNGEVLRRYSEMKSRWKDLQERIARVEQEMKGVEDMLKDAAGPEEIKDKDKDMEKPKRSAEFGSTLTPPRGSPVAGRISPLRRLANKISPTSTPTRPERFRQSQSYTSPSSSAMLPSTSATSGSSSPSTSSLGGAKPTPPRPPKSLKRFVSSSNASPSSPPQTPQPRPPALSHRRSASALSASHGSTSSNLFGASTGREPTPRRAISPMPMPAPSLAERPRWNPSARRTDEERETLSQSVLGNGRPGGGGGTPLANRNGRNSAIGLRSSSRMSMNSSMSKSYSGARPVSPAFSDASSAVRDRPSTPSRIPRPSSVIRPRSTTPYSAYDNPDTTSLMQRMASSPPSITSTTSRSSRPPLASARYSLNRSTGPSSFRMPRSSSASLLPTTGTLSPPRASSPSPSATSSSAFYYRGQTPEPNLMAHAQRLANVRPPPVPRVPSNYRASQDLTPRAGASGPNSSRPPSSLAYGRFGAFSPLPNGESTASAYRPNPLDPLDKAISEIINALPLGLYVERVDPPLSRQQADQIERTNSARYSFGLNPVDDQRKAVMLKLVDRVGPRAKKGEKKVLVRIGSGWQELESHCFDLMAQAV